jgi:hypothetical protein
LAVTTEAKTRTLLFLLDPLPSLQVKVITASDKKPVEGVGVLAGAYPELPTSRGAGLAKFDNIKTGRYQIRLKLTPDQLKKYEAPSAVPVVMSPGKDEIITIELTLKCQLRIVLFDEEGKAISGKAWELISPISASGTTGKDGLIEVNDLGLKRADGVLKVKMGVPQTSPKPPLPASGPSPDPNAPPPYPPPIKTEEFKDKGPEVPPTDSEGTLEWDLTLGLPEDYKDDAGLKTRLHNLGFNCEHGSDAPTTTRAVKHYQRLHQKQDNPSGALADIKGHITALHDNP